MPTKNNETEEENYNDNNQDDSNNRSYSIKDNEQPGNVNWWLNELDSLGIKKNNGDINLASNNQNSSSSSSNKTKPVSSRQLEDLTDDIKQTFIRDYKACNNE